MDNFYGPPSIILNILNENNDCNLLLNYNLFINISNKSLDLFNNNPFFNQYFIEFDLNFKYELFRSGLEVDNL
jgi:hypothetical protein